MRIVPADTVVSGNVYMVKMANGETDSFRVLSVTPTHFILSFSNGEFVQVFEKAKSEVAAIYDVKEWLAANKV